MSPHGAPAAVVAGHGAFARLHQSPYSPNVNSTNGARQAEGNTEMNVRRHAITRTAGAVLAGVLALSSGVFTGSNPAVADDEEFAVTAPLARAAMAEYTVVCDDAHPCAQQDGKNVPGGQTDGKRLLVGRESADDPGSDDSFVLLSEIDLSDVPAGAGIASATVTYQLTAGAPTDLEVRHVTSSWSGAPFATLPTLGDIAGSSVVVDETLVVDVTEIVQGAAGDAVADFALVPTNESGFGQVFSPTANPSARRPLVAIEFLSDDQPPSITLTAPASGPQFGDITVSADATDNVGVVRVELYVDGVLHSTDTQAPWEFVLDAAAIEDGPRFLTVRAVDGVGLSADDGIGIAVRNQWATPQRLDFDLEQGNLTMEQYATYAVDYVLGIVPLPNRYASSVEVHSLSGWFIGVLATWPDLDPAVRDALTVRLGGEPADPAAGGSAEPEQQSATTATAAAAPEICLGDVIEFPLPDFVDVVDVACKVFYPDFTITYPAIDIGGFSLDDNDGNGIPDEVDARAETFAASLEYYVSVLDFEPRSGTDIVIVPFLDSGLSIPNIHLPVLPDPGDIFIGAESGTTYLPSHEIFHQIQYNYFSVFDFTLVQLPWGGWKAKAELDSIRWYMEASAEWASHKWLESIGSDIRTYANDIDVFLAEPHRDLARVSWTNPSGPQYGAFIVPEYLQQRGGVSLVREVWEEVDAGSDLFKSPHVYSAMDRALDARGFGQVGDNSLDMWRTFYDLDFAPGIAAPDAVQDWRDRYLWARPATSGDIGAISVEGRMARISDASNDDPPGDAAILLSDGDVASIGDIDLDTFGGAVVEIRPDEPGIVYLEIDLDNRTAVDIRALDSYGGAECATATETMVGGRLEAVVPFDAGCHYVAVIFANESRDDQDNSMDIRFGDQPDKTIDNGTIRLGINEAAHLNVPGFDPSSGTGTSTVGLRLISTNADALSPGCECEGWGVHERLLDVSGWANNSYGGTENLDVIAAGFGDDSAGSTVWLGGFEKTVSVEHDYHPVPGVPYLYAVDVTVTNITGVNSDFPNLYYGPVNPVYRRVMDWDVEPTAFSEYVTIAAPGGVAPPEIMYTSNDGFGSPDPSDPVSDLGATGLFEDFGPDDHGAMIQIDLGWLDPFFSPRVTFTMYYGAAPDEATALDALETVGAELYSLGQPDTPTGATTGEPNTFIWGYKAGEGGYEPPVIAIASASASAAPTATSSTPGVVRN